MAQENAGKNLQDWFYYVELPIVKIVVKDEELLVSPFSVLGFYFSEYELFDKALSELYFQKDSSVVVEKSLAHPVRLKEPLSGEEYSVSHNMFTASALVRLSYYRPARDIPIAVNVLLYDTYSKIEKTIKFRGLIRGYPVRLPITILKESPSSVKFVVNYNSKTYVMHYSVFSMRIRDIFLPEDFMLLDLLKPKPTRFHTRVLRSKEERKIASLYSQNYDIMSFLQEK
jgi:hypothetical protein